MSFDTGKLYFDGAYVILSSYHVMGGMENLVYKENDYYEVKLWNK